MQRLLFPILLIVELLSSQLLGWEFKRNWTNSSSKQDEVLVLTYLHSGTNWTTSIIQIMNHNPIYMWDFLRQGDWREDWNNAGVLIDYNQPKLCFTHQADIIPENINLSTNKLLMVLRNYKECLVQTFQWKPNELLTAVQTNFRDYKIYMHNLDYYDKWSNPHTKLLVYYEDLIEDPYEEVQKIARFLNISQEKVDEFFQNYESWHAKVIQSYRKKHPQDPPTSGGKKALFHSENFPVDLLQRVDSIVKKEHQHLWEKYLLRYETFY